MGILEYLYVVPLFAGVLLLVKGFTKEKKDKQSGRRGFARLKPSEIAANLIDKLKYITPKKGSRAYGFYEEFLKHTVLNVDRFFKIKYMLALTILIVLLLAKYTNVSIYTKEIYTKFDYYTDLLYQFKGQIADENKALKQEIHYLNVALGEISKNEINQAAKEEIHGRIKNLIREADEELFLPKDTVVNKVYYRLYDYYKYRKLNMPLYVLVCLGVFFIPEVWVLIHNFFAGVDAKRELRFLKKLIIVNGSIKPVDFMELLELLIDKSKYYKKTLQEIQDLNKKNTVDNRTIYSNYIRKAGDLNTKLFFEKLDQANNYDFDQAIMNIENEFKLEKREQARRVSKQIGVINIAGIVGYMVLIVILIMYLLIPWLRSYNMNQII